MCDLVVCLGDLIDKEDHHQKEICNLREAAEVINGSLIETVCVMGNHDGFAFVEQEFYEILGTCRPTHLHRDGERFLFLDVCWFDNGRHYAPGDTNWKNTFFPAMCENEKAYFVEELFCCIPNPRIRREVQKSLWR